VPAGAGPDFLGRLHESLLTAADRKTRGAFYTPPAVADHLVGWALAGLDDPVVCDPACGGGAFLLAAARAGARRLVAMDIDPLAVAVCEAALWLAGADAEVVVGDALVDAWPGEVDVVVGNPPFLSQLDADTARSRERAVATGAEGYVDEAVLFLLAAARRSRHRVAMLQPESVVAVASAAAVRAELGPSLVDVWVPDGAVFDGAAVRVVGVLLDRDTRSSTGERWAPFLASARGVPDVTFTAHGTLGQACDVIAGFRDEYYGLAPHVGEDRAGSAPLITSGLIDAGVCLWGRAPARFGRRSWSAPAVDVEGLASSSLAPWAARVRVPKVLVATQTRVIEAVADVSGEWVPCTPVLTVVPRALDLWHVLAVLLAPPVTAWALHEASGSALSADAVKLSASQVRRIPLPAPGPDWDDAARALQRDDVDGAAEAMGRAYGIDVLDWWRARLAYGRRRG